VLLPLAGISGIGSTVVFYSLLRKIPDTLAESPRPATSAWHILQTDRRMPFYLAGVFLFGLGALISAPLYPVIQSDRLNISYTILGQLGFIQSLAWLLGCLFGGRMLDRLGGIRSLQFVFLVNAFVMLPYIWATQAWMLLPAYVAAGLVTAGTDLAILYTVLSLAGADRVPGYSALNSTVYGLRGLLGPFIGSLLMQNGFPFWIILSMSVILTLAGSVMLSGVKKIDTLSTKPTGDVASTSGR
jgi:predicted MFS family arabinose efflux permease